MCRDSGLPERKADLVNRLRRLDRRVSARTHVGSDTVLQAHDALHPSAPLPCTILDVSAGGAGLASGVRYEPGVILSVNLRNKAGDFLLRVPARVMHSRSLPDGDWFTGCAFLRPLTEHELRAILHSVAESSQ
jgi:c-di-GMP-binding flagellar brake protein YcgR